jgi:protein-L-isoaspartate(D-aspartate) O-methyltransferase
MNHAVMEAVASVDRGRFLPAGMEYLACADMAVPIAPGVTVPTASYTAWVMGLLEVDGDSRVLEVGTGSGYQAVCLSKLCAEVVTCDIDVVPVNVLEQLPENVSVYGDHDGRFGVYQEGEFDAILVTADCSAKDWDIARQYWCDQLRKGGVIVLPMGGEIRRYRKVQKLYDFVLDDEGPYAYAEVVPMRGRSKEQEVVEG